MRKIREVDLLVYSGSDWILVPQWLLDKAMAPARMLPGAEKRSQAVATSTPSRVALGHPLRWLGRKTIKAGGLGVSHHPMILRTKGADGPFWMLCKQKFKTRCLIRRRQT